MRDIVGKTRSSGQQQTATEARTHQSGSYRTVPRRTILRQTAATATGALLASPLIEIGLHNIEAAQQAGRTARENGRSVENGTELRPRDAVESILGAMDRFPLVALGERHLLQEMHDVLAALIHHPALPNKITDIIVEFGNSLYQDLADQFILSDKPVSTADLAQLWRFTIGGDILWDAPVYEQFFRRVRAINWMLPPSRRIRVLLADPPFDHRKVHSLADKDYALSMVAQRDAHYATIVEQEVVRKGRRALLIAGSNHLLRGIKGNDGSQGLNAASRLVEKYPNALYVIDLLVLPPGPQQDPLLQRAQNAVREWPRPAVATLTDTWLGATTQSVAPWINSAAYLASTPDSVRYGAQADAILYLGPGEVLTASQEDSTLYQSGPYRAELQRLSRLYTQGGQPTDYVGDGLRRAQAEPGWFNQYGGSK